MDKEQEFPAWFYGPKGESQIFQSGKEVPSGWKDHPAKHEAAKGDAAATKTAVAKANTSVTAKEAAKTTTADGTATESTEVDADGWPWQANLHAASKSKTGAGLWRMKVGVSRPAPKKLDL
jgi:hypothetical protein